MSASFLAGLVREVPRIDPPCKCSRLTSAIVSLRTWSTLPWTRFLNPSRIADHLQSVVDGLDGDRADDAVDARGRPAADDEREFPCRHFRLQVVRGPWSVVGSIKTPRPFCYGQWADGSRFVPAGTKRNQRARTRPAHLPLPKRRWPGVSHVSRDSDELNNRGRRAWRNTAR